MRIAISGTHRVGKSTLVEALAERLPGHDTVPEPYVLLEDDGHDFSDPPAIEDFEAQLERSLVELDADRRHVIFDRCPADVLAYLMAHEDADGFDADAWLERARAALETLELVVLVPIEAPDRVRVAAHEDRRLRRAVDEKLRALLLDGALGADVEVLVVDGDVEARVAQVQARCAR